MEELQFVYPSSHPFYAGFVILILSIFFLIGLYLLYLGIKKVKNRKWKTLLILIAIPLIAFPTINFIGYKHIASLTFQKHVGKYISNDKSSELNLMNNNKWNSLNLPFKCNTGNWALKITEDGTYVELSCQDSKYSFEQLWPSRDLKIYVFEDNQTEEKIELQKITQGK